MSRRPRAAATREVLGRLALAGVSSLVAVVVAVSLYSWADRARLDRRLLELVERQGVSAQTFNIYYFGSSSMAGEPYRPHASIPQIIELLLDGTVQGRPVRSVNLGESGADFAYALERVRQVIGHTDLTHPSLAVIYAGHNEFLKYSGRFGRLAGGLPQGYVVLAQRIDALLNPLEIDDRRPLDRGVVDERTRLATIERYGAELREAIAILSHDGVPTIVSTLASNYADWEPNRSVFCDGTADREAFARFMREGRSLEAHGELHAAIDRYRQALRICDSVAEAHYRLGWCYRRLADASDAWREYQRALDEDGMPIRATGAINDVIRSLGDGNLVTLVDAVQRLRDRSSDGLIGSEVMIDAHHPNMRGYVLISELIAGAIRDRFPAPGETQRAMDEAEAARRLGIGSTQRFEVAISRGRWYTRLATWRYDPGPRLTRAEALFEEARHIDATRYEPDLGLAMVQFLRGDAAGGERLLASAEQRNPEAVEQYLADRWVRQVRDRAHRVPVSIPAAGEGDR